MHLTHEVYEDILKGVQICCIYVPIDLPEGLAVDNDKCAARTFTNALHQLSLNCVGQTAEYNSASKLDRTISMISNIRLDMFTVTLLLLSIWALLQWHNAWLVAKRSSPAHIPHKDEEIQK